MLDSGHLAAGRWVRAFERAFGAYLGVAHAAATSSGTAALEIALDAADIRPGARVLTTPFSFVATSNAIIRRGAVPVFADIDPQTFNLDPTRCAEVLARTPGVEAVLLVHLYGLPCQMDAFMDLAQQHHLVVVEDAAQAHGAAFQGRKAGTFGAAGAFSFYPTKNLTTGEGGMVVSNDAGVAQRAHTLVNVGQSSQYTYEMLGGNARMTDIAAALGIGQLEKLEERNARRRRNAASLTAGLCDLDWLVVPSEPPGCTHVFHQYTLRVAGARDRLARHLDARGIGTRVYYPSPIHKSPLYRRLGFADIRCPHAERAAEDVLSIPVHPSLGEEEVRRIVQAIRDFNPRH